MDISLHMDVSLQSLSEHLCLSLHLPLSDMCISLALSLCIVGTSSGHVQYNLLVSCI